ncbi:hypothetical protein W97_07635 [Coniosporium apollinis CBS 100218]|uniref:Velvet domain-containing protein n=1 Tax=Coniosporium apollinis (strain CBS 100218) TaxID=1168221 RepID=R7Z2H9_CONA1|nr:uncharacterized protein W97_07635 [Coniosporium apollinis CBS 100218]EON68377.1 hypothetical protein W97_07635 [Coniosporium apollinis CBS 100218]
MSRPSTQPTREPSSTAALPPPAMTETQKLPNFPLPLDSYRRVPQPIHLPPLSIPSTSARHDYYHESLARHSLPPIQSGYPPRGPPRLPPTSAAVPAEKLVTSHPYTPPRSDPPYSPQYYGPPLSPRSEYESRLHQSRLAERYDRYPTDDSRSMSQDSSFVSSADSTQRGQYAPLPSPSYTSGYPPSNVPYRGSSGMQHSSGGPVFASSNYGEPAAAGPSNMLAAHGASQQAQPRDSSELHYELRVRQQPIAARACGFGERDRRVIDPPPIVQLVATDPRTGRLDNDEMRYSLNVVHCTLWNADATQEETALVQPDRPTTRRLMGQLVASPSVAKDEHDVEGCFFCFPDLSCRTHGRYRLRFVLMRIDPLNLHVGGFTPILAEVLSDVFTVYTAKDFPGMRSSSALTRALKLQGCNIQVKKGNDKSFVRKRTTSGEE